jgi:hypothetical protein
VAQLLTPQAPRPREPDTRSQAAPVIVCPADSSREAQRAAAVAASLSRGLGGQLALVHGGSTLLGLARFAAVAVQHQAALIVISAAPAEAQALAVLGACPIVVVPAAGPTDRPFDAGPVVCAVDRTQSSGHVAAAATRFALQLGAALQFVHIGRAASVEAISSAIHATLLVVSANRRGAMPELVLEAADIPVMLVPDRP